MRRKRISRAVFWLAILSIASSHEIILGLGTFVLAITAVLIVFLSPFIVAFGAWLVWYRGRHGRLPGWVSRDRLPDWISPARVPGWPVGLTPRRMRRRARRRWPRQPQPHEAPTAEMLVVAAAGSASPAGNRAGEAAAQHLP
jgi:hypothetical protein